MTGKGGTFDSTKAHIHTLEHTAIAETNGAKKLGESLRSFLRNIYNNAESGLREKEAV